MTIISQNLAYKISRRIVCDKIAVKNREMLIYIGNLDEEVEYYNDMIL